MKKKTSQKIIEYIEDQKQVTASDIADHLGISRQGLYKHLSKLLEKNKIAKVGTPPIVFYSINKKGERLLETQEVDNEIKQYIEEKYLIITPSGKRKNGWEGFVYWTKKINQPLVKTANEYIVTSKKFERLKKNGLINGLVKLRDTFPEIYLDRLYYLDFYSIERFGKTKMGQMLLYAKQSQNKSLIKELTSIIKPKIDQIIKKQNIDAIGFIPPTVKREVQFMRELEKNLSLNTPAISIIKIKTEVAVPQKTLSKLQDREENAHNTIIVDEKRHFKNILLLDDAVGSGATLNETAGQIKTRKIVSNQIIGLAITGSFKGFDVISEV